MKSIQLNIIFPVLSALFVCAFMAGCEQKKVILTPQGYDISQPEKFELGSKLDEISGIFWVNDSTMLANNDESGKIFAINLKNRKDYDYRNIKFAGKGDYEDIVKVQDTIYLLVATGSIVKVTGYKSEETIQSAVVATLPGNQNEFESMYYDADIHSLIMLCKECHKEKDKIRTAFRFDLATQTLMEEPYYKLDIQKIQALLNDDREVFKPSAAAINPVQQKLYVVASLGSMIVIADKKGNVEQAFRISPKMFPQPEGMTFSPNGDMYISNEIATEERATILRFPYTKNP